MTRFINRRFFAGSAAGFGIAAVSGRATLAQSATPSASPAASGEWTFTDDKGVTVTLPEAPKTLAIDVNAAAALWDFGVRPAAVFGWNGSYDGDFGMAGGTIDPAQVQVIGDANLPIDVEALVALEADLVITTTHVPEDPTNYWSLAADGPLEQVQQVAPIVAISEVSAADQVANRYGDLAVALGIDLDAPDLVAARDAWTAAEEGLKTALAAKPGISAIYVAPTADMFYIANPQVSGELQYLRSLGLTIPDVEIDPENGDFWQFASPEEIGAYQTDLIFSSYRADLDIEAFTAMPTVATLPAVANDQVFVWNQDMINSYQGLTKVLEDVTTAITDSEDVTD